MTIPQHSLFAVVGNVVGDGVAAVQDHNQSLAVVGFLEGRDAAHQHVQDHPQRPDIWNTHKNMTKVSPKSSEVLKYPQLSDHI